MGGEIAGAVRTVELLFDNALPGCFACIGRAGDAEYQSVVGDSAERIGLQ